MKIRMNQLIARVLTISAIFTVMSCGNKNVVETPGGLEVEFLTVANGEKFEVGDQLELNLVFATEDGETIFDTNKIGGPVRVMMTEDDKGLFNEMIQVMTVGDSAYCEIPVENVYEQTFQRPIPDSIARGTLLKFNVGIISAMSFAEITEKQKNIDIQIIDEYLATNEIVATVDEATGLRYEITKKGTGEKPEVGQKIRVHYTGKFLDGNKFDSSVDRGTPFEFTVGSGVIEGWSKGFALLNEGDVATLYIPSGLAYGPGGRPGIPRNAVLVFDVEFLEIIE